MDKKLKQRLVGASVVVALAVIIVPELVKEPVEQGRPVADTTIPPRPDPQPDAQIIPRLPSADQELTTALPAEGEITEPYETAPPLPEASSDEPAAEELPEIELVTLQPRPEPVSAEPPVEALPPAAPVQAAPPPPTASPAPPQPRRAAPPPAAPEPPRPAVQTAPAKPREPAPLPKIELIAKASTPATAPPPSAAPAPPPAAPSSGQGWMVQAGSFAAQRNAEQLRDRLRAQGFAAVVQPITLDGQTLYRVRVGPQASRGESEQTLERLERVAGLKNGRIVDRSDGW